MISGNIKQTKKIAENLARKILRLRLGRGAVIVGLSGELGSGKTTFAQCFARALGIKEKIHSPTFVILKTYNLQFTTYNHLIHIDVYRIKKPKEILDLGWEKIISDSGNIILAEWPEKIKKIFPKKHFWINFSHLAKNKRGIDIFLHK